ncbi:MAG: TrbC/VirB2 family protein [Candidatus Gracilibacteria bacterium]|nr:TrbC/VirB2 family protein [Candidatus Gracilibacteria bacterium]
MKLLIKLIVVFLLIISNFSGVDAGSIFSIGEDAKLQVDCAGDDDCDLKGGIEKVKNTVNDIEKDRKFSQYVQDVIQYILGFISLVAVIYIIYAGFMILIGAGDEDKLKKSKQTILYVIIGIVLIWLAYSIVAFIMDMLNTSS